MPLLVPGFPDAPIVGLFLERFTLRYFLSPEAEVGGYFERWLKLYRSFFNQLSFNFFVNNVKRGLPFFLTTYVDRSLTNFLISQTRPQIEKSGQTDKITKLATNLVATTITSVITYPIMTLSLNYLIGNQEFKFLIQNSKLATLYKGFLYHLIWNVANNLLTTVEEQSFVAGFAGKILIIPFQYHALRLRTGDANHQLTWNISLWRWTAFQTININFF